MWFQKAVAHTLKYFVKKNKEWLNGGISFLNGTKNRHGFSAILCVCVWMGKHRMHKKIKNKKSEILKTTISTYQCHTCELVCRRQQKCWNAAQKVKDEQHQKNLLNINLLSNDTNYLCLNGLV